MPSPRRRVAVLYEVWWPLPEQEPQKTLLGERPSHLDAVSENEREVHEEIYEALLELGHRPTYSVLDGDRDSLVKLARNPASVVFNLTESYAGDDTKDMHVAAYLELLGKCFTGASARALHLGQDKALTKKILAHHGLPTPDFVSPDAPVRIADPRADRALGFPLMVKPRCEDGSIGIDGGSLVWDRKALEDRVEYVSRHFRGGAMVEEYVEGREIYVAIVGNDPPRTLPLVELDFSSLPPDVPRIAGTEVKWWKGTDIYDQTPPVFPRRLSRELRKRIRELAVAAYRALGLRDYGRIDFRVPDGGEPMILEVNPNPWLGRESEVIMAWEKAGRSYPELVGSILELALERSRGS